MSFRTQGHGRSAKHFPITPPRGTAFAPAEHPELAKAVHAESEEGARESVRTLERQFRGAGTHATKERIRKAAQLEANRLDISAHNARNSPEARRSLDRRRAIFQGATDRMSHKLERAKEVPF